MCEGDMELNVGVCVYVVDDTQRKFAGIGGGLKIYSDVTQLIAVRCLELMLMQLCRVVTSNGVYGESIYSGLKFAGGNRYTAKWI